MATEVDVGSYTLEGAMLELSAAIGTGGGWNGAKAHLYQASFTPGAGSKAEDFAAAEADYTGYASAPLTYSAIGVDAGGNPTSLSARVFFQPTDAVAPNSIGGVWVEKDVTGPPAVETSIVFFPFAAPIPMNGPTNFIGIVIGVQEPGGPGYVIVDH